RDPVIKLGHVDPRFDGQPAIGQVKNLRLSPDGDRLIGDLTGMPGWLAEVAASAYPNRSIENVWDHQCQVGHRHPFAVTGLALLGVAPPAVAGLNDIRSLFQASSGGNNMGRPANEIIA